MSRDSVLRIQVESGFVRLWPALTLLALAGLARGWRLAWQPLWWDEGYSVYFATEPVGEMLRLTAQDIHPPLYYGLLRGWLLLVGDASPVVLRSFSLLVGILAAPAIWWLARRLFPGRRLVWLLTALLLLLNPMHLFYSQEVRMYGLAMLLGMLSTGFAWQLCMLASRHPPGVAVRQQRVAGIGYALSTIALLYTEYYGALLPLGHVLWALWVFRRRPGRLRTLFLANLAIGLAYLPWLLFTVPELISYVAQKVVADADRSLSLPVYLWRHLLAFSAGHVEAEESLGRWGQRVGTVLALAIGVMAFALQRRRTAFSAGQPQGEGERPAGVRAWREAELPLQAEGDARRSAPGDDPAGAQLSQPSAAGLSVFCLLVPTVVTFLINVWMPFSPHGGERVLLFVLPYFLLLNSLAFDSLLSSLPTWMRRRSGDRSKASHSFALVPHLGVAIGLAALPLAAGAGVWAFYTVPRYTTEDYRPLIHQTVQQGSDTDTVFAVFPWQVGYWRAYAPAWGRADIHGPLPVLSPSPAWNTDVAAALDMALARGKLWFPAHLSMGGILEGQIVAYLRNRADVVNFEERWYSGSTRLSGWAAFGIGTAIMAAEAADFGPVQLLPQSAQIEGSGSPRPAQYIAANEILPVRLHWRVEDASALPLNISLRLLDENERLWSIRDFEWTDGWGEVDGIERRGVVGLLLPVGVPPGQYTVVVGVGSHRDMAVLGTVQLQPPAEPLPPLRLPIRFPLAQPESRDGIRFLGASGYDLERPTLAGTELAINLFVQAESSSLPAVQLYVGLLDDNGTGLAGWEGWPLPDYPTVSWRRGGLVRLPVRFFLPADLPAGRYRPIAGLLDPESGHKSASVAFAHLAVVQRPHNFSRPQPEQSISPPIQLGIHVRLLGYDIRRREGNVDITFYWEALQPLLPPHQVFVHLVNSADAILAREDAGLPDSEDVPMPSGTWLPGEFLVDAYQLILPDETAEPLQIYVGLYDIASGQRLRVTDGVSALPDAISIPVPAK